ncbi:MAG TPA: molybdopterin-dependent oxidoreductase [Caulobacteraceae bacterium]|nr:molybdopterin-dependent oxidoreductase [Caulobacteraceae bacterium]
MIRSVILAAAGCLATLAPAYAQELELEGLDNRPIALTRAEFAALPHTGLKVDIEGKTGDFDGVELATMLARIGAPTGKALRGPELRDVVVVMGRDGYAAVLALAEVDPMVRREKVIVADELDGRPLPAIEGPYRLVVEGDQRGARMVRMVTAIQLRRVN